LTKSLIIIKSRINSSLFRSPNYEAQERVDLLKVLKDLKLINYSVKINQEKKNLEAVVFSSNGMIDLYEQYKDMIKLDTTFGLNKFDMLLLTMTGVNNNGQTIIFCYAIIQEETCEMKKWVFETFKKFSNEEPDAIILDGCPAFANAIKEVFLNTKHYRCAWNISQNKIKNLKAKKDLQKKVILVLILFYLLESSGLYDNIMKLPFISSKEIYEQTLKEISTSEIISDQSKKYIEFLMNPKKNGPSHSEKKSISWKYKLPPELNLFMAL